MSCEVVYGARMTITPHQQQAAKGWMPDDSTFGARLALIRQRMQWGNVREAAIECGIPPESWRTWERDNVTPRRVVDISTLIAQRTGCDLGWLIAGSAMAGRIEIATAAARDPKRVSDQVSRLPAPVSTARAPRPTHRPTGRASGTQRRPVSVRSPGHTMPSAQAA